MAIAINSKELLTLLEVTPSWQNIMLTGRHGIKRPSEKKLSSFLNFSPNVTILLSQTIITKKYETSIY